MKTNILVRPVITEKSMKEAAKNRYTFAVAKESNKHQINQAVKEAYKVSPLAITTIMVKGKTKMNRNTRQTAVAQNWKKATVVLPTGVKIDAFDVTEGGAHA